MISAAASLSPLLTSSGLRTHVLELYSSSRSVQVYSVSSTIVPPAHSAATREGFAPPSRRTDAPAAALSSESADEVVVVTMLAMVSKTDVSECLSLPEGQTAANLHSCVYRCQIE